MVLETTHNSDVRTYCRVGIQVQPTRFNIKSSFEEAVCMRVVRRAAWICSHRVGMLHRPVAHAVVGPPELDEVVVSPRHEQDIATGTTAGVHFGKYVQMFSINNTMLPTV